MRNTTGTRTFDDPRWFAVNKAVIRYNRKDSVGSIVRTFPKGRHRKPPSIRARCYAPAGNVTAALSV